MARKAKTKHSKRSANSTQKRAVLTRPWYAVPLTSSFMATSIIGFLVTAYFIYPMSTNFGLAFMLVFTAMFIASLISMTKASVR